MLRGAAYFKNLYKCVSDKFLEAKIWQPSNCHGQGLLKDLGPRPMLTSVLKQRSRTRYPRKSTVSKETSSHLSLRFSLSSKHLNSFRLSFTSITLYKK